MLGQFGRWLDGLRIAWLFAFLVPVVIAAALVASGYKPEECADDNGSNYVPCRFLFALVAELRWLRELAESNDKVLVGIGTVAIAGFTLALWRSTDRLWAVTKDSVDAAKRASDDQIRLNRPYIFIASTTLKFEGESGDSIVCDYSLENYGSSPAVMESLCVDVRTARVLPSTPEYFAERPLRRILYPQKPVDEFRASHVERTRNEGDRVFIVAKFEYWDVFGAKIVTAVAYVAEEITGRLLRTGGPAYNYDRRENHHQN